VEKCTAGQGSDENMEHRIACWIPKAINTHSEYAIFNTFPLQQRLQGRDFILRYTYISSAVSFIFSR
jgi:hypothetical protein